MTIIEELPVYGSNGTTDVVLVKQNYTIHKSHSGTTRVPSTITHILRSSGEELNYVSDGKFEALSTDVIYEVR